MFLVHAAYGRAMLRAHGLERDIATLLICYTTFTPDEVAIREAQIARIKRLPLGPLIDKFVQAFQPTDDLIEELDNLLFFRNELTHRISEMILHAGHEVAWEERVLKELADIQSYFDEVTPFLRPYMDSFRDKIGIGEDRMRELVKKLYPGMVNLA